MHQAGIVADEQGRPVDGGPPLPQGEELYTFRNDPPPAHSRRRVGRPLDLGVRALNAFLTCCLGQRMGIFAGSGVGKSVLLSMLARYARADVNVIGLVGERGREVQEFLQDDLGPEGLARSVVVVATSSWGSQVPPQSVHTTVPTGKRALHYEPLRLRHKGLHPQPRPYCLYMYHQRLQGDSGSSAGGADTLQPSTDTRRLDSIRAHFHQPASGDIIVVQALLKQAQKGGSHWHAHARLRMKAIKRYLPPARDGKARSMHQCEQRLVVSGNYEEKG